MKPELLPIARFHVSPGFTDGITSSGEGLKFVIDHDWPSKRKDEMSHSDFPVLLDPREAFVFSADHYAIAHLVGCSSGHRGDSARDHLRAFFGRFITQRHHDGFFDLVGVSSDRVAVALDDVDEVLHLIGI